MKSFKFLNKSIISRLVLVLLLTLSLYNCTKFGKNVTVKGKVFNPLTQLGVQDVKLELLRSSVGLPGGFKKIKTETTTTDGSYEISRAGVSHYYLQCSDIGENYPIGWFKDGKPLESLGYRLKVKRGKTMHADFYTVPYGQLKISLNNINCLGETDTLIYNRSYISFEDITVFVPMVLTGCITNPGAYAQVPSGEYLVEWTVIRNGTSTSFNHTLLVEGNQQTSYDITY